MSLRDELYQTILESPLGVNGVDKTLPALEELLRELRHDEFWEDKRRQRRLSEQQMILAWAQYRQDLRALRDRLRQRQQSWDDLLTWLAMFLVQHYEELARISAIHMSQFQLAFDRGDLDGPPEAVLAMQSEWQAWVVDWLRDALRDEEIDPPPTILGGNTGGSDGDGDLSPFPRPSAQPDDTPGISY